MAIRLKSVLPSPRSLLVLKSALFLAALFFASTNSFSPLATTFFVLVALALFFWPVFQTIEYLIVFAAFLAVGLLFLKTLPVHWFWLGGLCVAILFYLISGVKNLVIVHRFRAFGIFSFTLIYLSAVLFFLNTAGDGFFFRLLLLFFVSAVIGRQLFKIAELPDISWSRRSIVAWLLAFLVAEASWAIALLPIGFLQASALLFLIVFFFQDLAVKFYRDALNRRALYSGMAIFIFLAAIIFLTSHWTI